MVRTCSEGEVVVVWHIGSVCPLVRLQVAAAVPVYSSEVCSVEAGMLGIMLRLVTWVNQSQLLTLALRLQSRVLA